MTDFGHIQTDGGPLDLEDWELDNFIDGIDPDTILCFDGLN